MFIELFAQVKAYFQNTNVDFIGEQIAYQFHIVTEEGADFGDFYLEVKDGKLFVEPYDYYDSSATITTSADTVLRIAKGDLEPIFAHTVGLVNIVGDMDKTAILRQILESAASVRKVESFKWIEGDKYINVSTRDDGVDGDGNFLFVMKVTHSDHQSYGQLFSFKCDGDFEVVELPGDVYCQREGDLLTVVRSNQLNDNGLTEIWIKIKSSTKPVLSPISTGKLDLVC